MTNIRIITEPTVHLVGEPRVRYAGVQGFLNDNNASDWESDAAEYSEELCEIAGRLCYMSFSKPRPGGNKAYLDRILESGHGSVIEHANWCFIFEGISRSLSHELVRHRAGWAYSQLSQRYVDESDVAFVVPPEIDAFPMGTNPWNGWVMACENALSSYRTLVNALDHTIPLVEGESSTDRRKRIRQTARSVLPNCTETKIFATANARALRHFIEMRASRHADTEIRKLAVAVLRILQKEAVNLFADYELIPLPDGTFEAQTKWRKV